MELHSGGRGSAAQQRAGSEAGVWQHSRWGFTGRGASAYQVARKQWSAPLVRRRLGLSCNDRTAHILTGSQLACVRDSGMAQPLFTGSALETSCLLAKQAPPGISTACSEASSMPLVANFLLTRCISPHTVSVSQQDIIRPAAVAATHFTPCIAQPARLHPPSLPQPLSPYPPPTARIILHWLQPQVSQPVFSSRPFPCLNRTSSSCRTRLTW